MGCKRAKPNFFLYWAACSVNLLSVNLAGMFSWSSPSIPKLTSNDTSINPLGHPITSSEESLVASLSTLGAIAGTLLAGIQAEKFGRKSTLIVFSLPFFFCYPIIAHARHIIYLYLARFCLGLSSGSVLSLLPSYIGEISEDSNRGALGSIFGIMTSVGYLITYTFGPIVSIRTFAYIQMIPVTLFFITFIPFIPESPYHYLSKNDTRKARKSLRKIRSNQDIEHELRHLMETFKKTTNEKLRLRDIASSLAVKRALFVCFGLMCFQQTLGIAITILYLQPILEASGNIIPVHIASMLIGIVQIISCCVATSMVDRYGRKILLHISCCISLFALGTYFILNEKNYELNSVFWLPVATLIVYYIFFFIGYNTLPWSICGELFETNVKSFCTSLTSCFSLILAFMTSASFPFLRDAFGMGGVFFVFAGLGSFASVFVFMFVPETKGKTFQEIQYKLNRK